MHAAELHVGGPLHVLPLLLLQLLQLGAPQMGFGALVVAQGTTI